MLLVAKRPLQNLTTRNGGQTPIKETANGGSKLCVVYIIKSLLNHDESLFTTKQEWILIDHSLYDVF